MRRLRHKYGAKRTEYDGHSFASKLEAGVYGVLKLMEKAGEIEILKVQDHVYLTEARIHYIPDFKCQDLKSGELFWVEAKGFETPEWKIKLRLWKAYGPGPLHIWRGSALRPALVETVIPRRAA